jgi:hypothetical protein
MKRRNQIWTCYLKTNIGRQVLWVSLALSAASLLVAGIALALQGRPGRHIEGSIIKQREDAEQAPSSNFIKNDANHFLTFNGLDTAESACTYYKAIEAITEECKDLKTDGKFNFFHFGDAKGEIVGITFDAWKKTNGLNDITGEVSALYFNAVDLAFARSMHGKSAVNDVLGETIAYYVCNYDTLEQARKDFLLNSNETALACVAFDFSEKLPFTKFYVFKKDPKSGNFRLAASAALDQGGEKFVPGLCQACHGQAFVPSKEKRVPDAEDLSAHFLPFDLDNFDYLKDPAFSRSAQESNFKRLNQMIPDPTPVVIELIEGWYNKGRLAEQNSEFIPNGWKGHEQLYKNVVKPVCRTCHVALSPDFKGFDNFRANAGHRDNGRIVPGLIETFVCDNAPSTTARKMPQAAVTFDQLWLNPAARAVLARFLRDARGEPSFQCPPPPP